MLTIKKEFNFDEFERCLGKVRGEAAIRLPSQILDFGLWGVEVALIQFLISWSRQHPSPVIKTYINNSDTDSRGKQLNSLGSRLFGISSLYLAGSVTTAQGEEIEKEEYARHCTKVLNLMDICDIHSAKSVNATYPRNRDKVAAQFLCLHGSRHEFQGGLYNSKDRTGGIVRSEFHSLVKSALGENMHFSRHLEEMPTFSRSISSLVYELFQNTNDHAYDDLEGSTYPKNVRGVSIKSHSDLLGRKDLTGMISQNSRFNDYLEFCEELFRARGLKMLRFLEVSVVDGGAGFAQQFSGKPLSEISLEEERQVTKACFINGVSSKESQSRGEGLDAVWKGLCQLNGFIRVRTGRLCLFQAFHDKAESDDRAFSDWSDDPLATAYGSAVTIIVPCVF